MQALAHRRLQRIRPRGPSRRGHRPPRPGPHPGQAGRRPGRSVPHLPGSRSGLGAARGRRAGVGARHPGAAPLPEPRQSGTGGQRAQHRRLVPGPPGPPRRGSRPPPPWPCPAAPDCEADTLDSLGYLAQRGGRHAEALDQYQRTLARYRDLGNTYGEADTLDPLGATHPRRPRRRRPGPAMCGGPRSICTGLSTAPPRRTVSGSGYPKPTSLRVPRPCSGG
jgi:hypothetical protein